MQRPNKERLVQAAVLARERAVAPYSEFRVGAALLAANGKIVMGANVESASYGLTCCAERVALFKALSDGEREFQAVAVVAEVPGGPRPCGACRQLLAEYAPHAVVWMADTRRPGTVKEMTVADLLPEAFLRVPRTSSKAQTSSPSTPRVAAFRAMTRPQKSASRRSLSRQPGRK